MTDAFEWARENGGLCAAAAWPYDAAAAAAGACATKCAPVGGSAVAATVAVAASEAALLAAVAIQPVVAAIHGLGDSPFLFYDAGVLSGACGDALDHGVLVVGYGVDDASGLAYWKVKNDFGADYGEAGYARLARGADAESETSGECGVLLDLSRPVLSAA